MIGRPVVVVPNAPAQANSGLRVELREKPAELFRDALRLFRDQRVALVLVAEVLILAAADDAAIGGRAHVEIGIGRLPDQGFARPEARLLRSGGDGPGRDDLVIGRAGTKSISS